MDTLLSISYIMCMHSACSSASARISHAHMRGRAQGPALKLISVMISGNFHRVIPPAPANSPVLAILVDERASDCLPIGVGGELWSIERAVSSSAGSSCRWWQPVETRRARVFKPGGSFSVSLLLVVIISWGHDGARRWRAMRGQSAIFEPLLIASVP